MEYLLYRIVILSTCYCTYINDRKPRDNKLWKVYFYFCGVVWMRTFEARTKWERKSNGMSCTSLLTGWERGQQEIGERRRPITSLGVGRSGAPLLNRRASPYSPQPRVGQESGIGGGGLYLSHYHQLDFTRTKVV